MLTKRGIPVSHGVAIAPAVVLDAADHPIPRRLVPPSMVAQQHQRVEAALNASQKRIEQQKEQIEARLGMKIAGIFAAHVEMLRDPTLLEQIKRLIDTEHVTAEYAVFDVLRRYAQAFRAAGSDKDRDIWDIERHLLGHLIGRTQEQLAHLTYDAVLVAHDLTPSQTASLDKDRVKGIATDLGGLTSHTAILAHALGIPAVVGIGDLSAHVSNGDMIIVDGNRGHAIIDPDAAQTFNYRQEMSRITEFEHSLDEMTTLPSVTTDGTEVSIWANIEFPEEIDSALTKGAAGIGLYRTEFLYLSTNVEPTEQEHYRAYSQAIESLGGKPLTIRTLDLGADKLTPVGIASHVERNPFLGVRSIRLCLQHPKLFQTQLRAILRASTAGPVRIMFPLISSIMELRQAKMILNDVKDDLNEHNIAFDPDIPVGIMVEVPAAAIEAAKLAREVDFFSIGTNDLVQYTLAVDRGNERIASLYSAAHPAVLQLVKDVVRAASRAKIDVSLCGEMAGEPQYVMLLLGLGLRSLSITPPAIPEVKKMIRSVSITHCRRVARKVMSLDSDREVTNYLKDEVRKIIPEAYDGRSITG